MNAHLPPHSTEETSVALARFDARIGVVENGMTTLGIKIDGLVQMFNASRQTNWPLLLTAISMFCTLAVGVWYFIEIKVKLNSAETLAPVLVQNAISTKEREENRDQTNRLAAILQDEVQSRKAGFAALQQQVVESETQHRARDAVSQLQFQHLEGWLAWLYAHSKLPSPPPMTYMPSIGREVNTPIPNQ